MQWEYKTLVFKDTSWMGGVPDAAAFDEQLNRMGARGWELANSFPTAGGKGYTRAYVFVFKRPVAPASTGGR